MPPMTLPAEGGCRCGRIRFQVTAPPLLTMACHCRGCQRMTAGAYSLSIAVPDAGFAIVQGDPDPGGLHADGQDHRHCGWCKSWLFTRLPPAMGFVNVRTAMLDDPPATPPFIETCTAEAFSWAATGATHSFAAFPPVEAYAGLLDAFADQTSMPA